MNRRGTDKIMSVYWFVILFIVAAAVVYMAVLFYGEPYDVREAEAKILINQVADCFSRGGGLVDGWEEKTLESCSLNFETEDVYGWGEQEQYYVKIEFLNFNTGAQEREPIEKGNKNLIDYCDKGNNFPVCVSRSFYAVDGGSQYEIKILSAVRKTEKNA